METGGALNTVDDTTRKPSPPRPIRALVARLQEIGLARQDIDRPALGELVFNYTKMMFIEFVKRDEARILELRAAIRRQNRILVAAIEV